MMFDEQGALRVNTPLFNFNPGRTFIEQIIKCAIHSGASQLQHAITIGFEPPCTTALEPDMADKFVG